MRPWIVFLQGLIRVHGSAENAELSHPVCAPPSSMDTQTGSQSNSSGTCREGCGRDIIYKKHELCHACYQRLRHRGQLELTPYRPYQGRNGNGSIFGRGYRQKYIAGHPLSPKKGSLSEHRRVLYDAIGEGPHPCHWCGLLLYWKPGSGQPKLTVDHLNDDRLDNRPANLVPACNSCQVLRSRLPRAKV